MKKWSMCAMIAVLAFITVGVVGCDSGGDGDGDEGSSALSHPYPSGTRVIAIVNGPSGSTCIVAGNTGTIFCYDASDPNLPYLVNWDVACGFSQSQVCGVTAPNGWWVAFSDVNALNAAVAGDLVPEAGAVDDAPKNQ
ncbi:MAG: hypothetical protein HQ523_11410 [Lentisphaerae bacterium]|nr:hypothetical protein [Lentisphaerota bacterium]